MTEAGFIATTITRWRRVLDFCEKYGFRYIIFFPSLFNGLATNSIDEKELMKRRDEMDKEITAVSTHSQWSDESKLRELVFFLPQSAM